VASAQAGYDERKRNGKPTVATINILETVRRRPANVVATSHCDFARKSCHPDAPAEYTSIVQQL
jgi:hypothetical protein